MGNLSREKTLKSPKILLYMPCNQKICLFLLFLWIKTLTDHLCSSAENITYASDDGGGIFPNRVAPAKQRDPLNVNSDDVTDLPSFQESKTSKNCQKSEEKVASFAQNL